MLRPIPAGGPGRTGQDEGPHRLPEGGGEFTHHLVALMHIGNVILVVGHHANEWEGSDRCLIIGVLREAEQLRRSHVIAGNRQVDQKVPREQVPPISGRVLIGVDEYVGKWGGRVPDVRPLLECAEELPYPSVYDGWVLIAPTPGGPGVDRGKVRLVIYHQRRDIGYRPFGVHEAQRLRPPGQVSQDGPIFLHHHDDRVATQSPR